MDAEDRVARCDVCNKSVPDGPRKFGLRRIALYDIRVCLDCEQENAEGWLPKHEERVLANIQARGGRLPRRLRNKRLPFEWS